MTAYTQTDNCVPTIEIKWRALLQCIKPVYGNPDADRIAEILKADMNGEDTSGRKFEFIAEKEYLYSLMNPDDDDKTMSNTSNEDDDAMSAEEREVWENWGSAGGPPLPGRRFIDGEWKTVPYTEWTEADKALAEEIFGNESEEDEEEDGYEMTTRFLNGLSKERLIELILMSETDRNDAINAGIDQEPETTFYQDDSE